ncbi:MAG: aldehyde dehydrogenase family protein, partial [Planctomycetota bacterium]
MVTLKVHSPNTGEFLYEVKPAAPAGIEAAYQRARQVQPKIAALSLDARVREMVKISDYVIDHQEAIIDRLTRETGKSRFDALSTEIFEICDGIDYYRDRASKILTDKKVHTPLVLMGKKSKVI